MRSFGDSRGSEFSCDPSTTGYFDGPFSRSLKEQQVTHQVLITSLPSIGDGDRHQSLQRTGAAVSGTGAERAVSSQSRVNRSRTQAADEHPR